MRHDTTPDAGRGRMNELPPALTYEAWCGVCGKVSTHVGGECVECRDVSRPALPVDMAPEPRASGRRRSA